MKDPEPKAVAAASHTCPGAGHHSRGVRWLGLMDFRCAAARNQLWKEMHWANAPTMLETQ